MSFLIDVKKRLKGFNLQVRIDQISQKHGILGPSGCGKSMTLKMIAGVIRPDEGKIIYKGKTFFDSEKKIDLSPQERRVGYLFQNYALFGNMTVAKNIGIGLKKDEKYKVEDVLKKFSLEGLENRLPSQLSGGQQQRVALARCLAYSPDIIMLDEPFSALDEFLKEKVHYEVKNMLQNYEGQIITVSHSREEIYKFCDTISIINKGKVIETDHTKSLMSEPKNVNTARISGCKNISKVKKVSDKEVMAVDWGIKLKLDKQVKEDIKYVGIRAHHVKLYEEGKNSTEVEVKDLQEGIFDKDIFFKTPQGFLWWKGEKKYKPKKGDKVKINLPEDKLLLLQGEEDETN